MRQISGQTFTGRTDSGPRPAELSDLVLEDCFFDNCVLAGADSPLESRPAVRNPKSRPLVRNVLARGCRQRGSAVFGAVLEDVTIDGLGRDGRHPLFVWSPAFKHVVLRGKLSAPKFNATLTPDGRGTAEWTSANREFYEDVDWALDISEAHFQGAVNLEAVPGHLVRRDPDTQVLVRRAQLEGVDLRSLALPDPSVVLAIDWFLQDGPYDSVVLAAAKGARYFRDEVASLRRLREMGIAESE
jgi:hypothetical protein